jgi:SAM-dependent methyltransferase
VAPSPSSPRRGPARVQARTALVRELLDDAVAARARAVDRPVLDVVDVGGGTGGFAVPLAAAGHQVVVVDPSPDALAALERRSAEAPLAGSVRAVQGDAADLLAVVGPQTADLVLCHGVLEVVDDPAAALAGLVAVLRPGGVVSVLVAQRRAAVLARAVAGHLAEAATALADPDGRWGPSDPLPRRFDRARLEALLGAAGLAVEAVHGIRVFADLVPAATVDLDPEAAEVLPALEAAASTDPVLLAVAAQLHVLATLPASIPVDHGEKHL